MSIEPARKRRANRVTTKGKDRGQMRPFSLEQVVKLERYLQSEGSRTSIRDLALFRVGVDTMLRSSELVALTLRSVCPNGEMGGKIAVKQKKTGKLIHCEIEPKTQTVLKHWLAINPTMQPDDRVFAITTRQHQRIVDGWCDALGLDKTLYSTHSIRRTRPSYVYAQTKNIAAAQRMLGHKTSAATSEYLGVNEEEAFAIARLYPI